MQLSWLRMPFAYKTEAEYAEKLAAFVGDAFYEHLPAAGFEVREEQIYSSFQIARAMTRGKTIFAEAGPGTGKTLAYLLPAICHARLKGAPVVVSVAGSALQSQLVSPSGDIATLSRLLGLKVDARLARHPREHLCEIKVERARVIGGRARGLKRMLQWAETSAWGDRTEVADVPDETWRMIAWDETLPCDTCERRGFCRQVLAREQYRKAADLIICDHDLFLADLQSRRDRQEEGRRPLLPNYSGVIFDEGHLIADAAARSNAVHLRPTGLGATLRGAGAGSNRTGLQRAVEQAERAAERFWGALAEAVQDDGASRLHVDRTDSLVAAARMLAQALTALQDELVVEEAMNEGLPEEERVVALQARMDEAQAGLALLAGPAAKSVAWAALDGEPNRYQMWIVSRGFDQLFRESLYSQRVPVVFSSATLASGDSFAYMERLVGAPGALHTQVGVPFDLEEQALVYVPPHEAEPLDQLGALLEEARGRTLILLRTRAEQEALRQQVADRKLPWTFLWEGDADHTELIRRFKKGGSVLVGTSYWEGVDIPGDALSCVVVLQLPFPDHDPVVTARREDAAALGLEPFAAVDLPAMAIKLKQGRGRLIRTATDRGVFALLDRRFIGAPYEDEVRRNFPEGAAETESLADVRAFFAGGDGDR